MTDDDIQTNFKVIFALTLVHFTGDFYNSFINPLFPLFVAKLNLSLAQVGVIAGSSRLLAFIVQPSVGYISDRYQNRGFILGGLLLGALFIPLSGIAPSFWLLLPCLAVGSIGSSMYHPTAAGMLPTYAGRKAGLAMSIFNTGGTLSFALGPIFITWYAAAFGLESIPLTMAIGLLSSIYLYRTVPQPQSEGLQKMGFVGSLREMFGDTWKAILLILLVMVLRAVVGQAFQTFMPMMFVQRGYTLVSAGVLFSFFILAGTVSGISAGYISDRIGFKPIFLSSFALMTPTLMLLFYLPGRWIYLAAPVAGFFTLATLPLGVVMAQKLVPKGRSMMASLMMGFAFGIGGFVSPAVGKLADLYSIEQVLFWVALIPLPTLGLILLFPDIGRRAPIAPVTPL